MSEIPQVQKPTDEEIAKAHETVAAYIERLYGTSTEEITILDSPKFADPIAQTQVAGSE